MRRNEIKHRQPIKDKDSFSDSVAALSIPNYTLPIHFPEDTASSLVVHRRPKSFEDPFDDPALEPRPLKTNVCQEAQHIVSKANHHNNVSHSFAVVTKKEESVARLRPFQDEKWKASFQRLLEFKHKFGHCCVPHSYAADRPLALWVKRQRHQYKKFEENDPTSTLTTSRFEHLMAIGFVWDSRAAAWMEKLNELKAFKESQGHCNVPSTYKENLPLSTWVKSQRRQYKLYLRGSPSNMTMPRFKALKSLGFVFDPLQTSSKNKGGLEMQG